MIYDHRSFSSLFRAWALKYIQPFVLQKSACRLREGGGGLGRFTVNDFGSELDILKGRGALRNIHYPLSIIH